MRKSLNIDKDWLYEKYVVEEKSTYEIAKIFGCAPSTILRKLKQYDMSIKSPIKDLTGKTFGRLTVVADSGKRSYSRNVIWICKCECGNTTHVPSSHLSSGNTKSCGCLQREIIRENGKKNQTFPDYEDIPGWWLNTSRNRANKKRKKKKNAKSHFI